MRAYVFIGLALLILFIGTIRFILRGETHDRPQKLMSLAYFQNPDGLGHALAMRFWAQLDAAESVELHTDAKVDSSIVIWEAFRNQAAIMGLKNSHKLRILDQPAVSPRSETQVVWKIVPMTEAQLKKAKKNSKILALVEEWPDRIFYLFIHEDKKSQ